jgi:hypothetical protein
MPFVANNESRRIDQFDGIMGLAPIDFENDNYSIPLFMNFLYTDFKNIWGGY